jgi:predicted TIM-barrel fold metal-dependent hydrolase
MTVAGILGSTMRTILLCCLVITACLLDGAERTALEEANGILLKDYRPVSIHQVPRTTVTRARHPAIDVHTHDYAKTPEEVDRWVAAMDGANIRRSIVLTFATGDDFAALVERYGRHPTRFELWCSFDFAGCDQPGWSARAVAELERCQRLGARGVGELIDKGMGFRPLATRATVAALIGDTLGPHLDDPRLKPLLERCADLRMPVNVHVAEDAWMYLPPDASNDGLMNAAKWKVDLTRPGIAGHEQLITTLAEAVRDNPRTTFIACHLANCCADLARLGRLLDEHPNLYADISARYGEIAPIPRTAGAFIEKYRTRLLFGTDYNFSGNFYPVAFRILESADEHFYDERIRYHWALHGLALSDETLRALYHGNAERILARPE